LKELGEKNDVTLLWVNSGSFSHEIPYIFSTPPQKKERVDQEFCFGPDERVAAGYGAGRSGLKPTAG
jgi:hypothetical protein